VEGDVDPGEDEATDVFEGFGAREAFGGLAPVVNGVFQEELIVVFMH